MYITATGAFPWCRGCWRACALAVVAMIASAGVTLVNLSFFGADALPAGLADVDLIAVLLFAAALFVLRRWKKDPILVMAGAGAAGLVLYTLL